MINLKPSQISRLLLVLFSSMFFLLQPQFVAKAQDVPCEGCQIFLPLILNQKPSPWIGPSGGKIIQIVADPTNPDRVYAATFGGGVYKSEDAGTTWQPISKGLDNLIIQSIAIDPKRPNILYAGTYGDKVYKSTDSGTTWFQSSSGIQNHAIVYTIAVDPVDSNRVYIGTRDGTLGSPPWRGIVYRTSDGGANWSVSLSNVGGSDQQDWAYSILVNPKSNNMIFAATHEHGPYRSTDYGANWQQTNTGFGTDLSSRSLVINPAGTSSDALYIGLWHQIGVYKSTNNAGSWSLASNGIGNTKVYALALDPVSPSTIYLANYPSGVYKTSDSASSWRQVGLADKLMYNVSVNPLRHTQVFAGTVADGLYRSDNSGSSWFHSQTGLNNTSIVGLVVKPDNSNVLYAGMAGSGVNVSSNTGNSWSSYNSGLADLNLRALIVQPNNANVLFALTQSAGLYRMYTPENQWKPISISYATSLTDAQILEIDTEAIDPIEKIQKDELRLMDGDASDPAELQTITTPALNTMVFAPSNSNIAFLGSEGGGVYKSSNQGISWSTAGLSGQVIRSLAVNPGNANIVYAATSTIGAIQVSNNGGSSWSPLDLSGKAIYSLSYAPKDDNLLFIGTDQGVYTKPVSGAFQATGLTGISVRVVAAHPTRAGVVIAGTTNGVYYSFDKGVSWKEGPDNLAGIQINAINFDSNNSQLVYLGTATHGTYRLTLN